VLGFHGGSYKAALVDLYPELHLDAAKFSGESDIPQYMFSSTS